MNVVTYPQLKSLTRVGTNDADHMKCYEGQHERSLSIGGVGGEPTRMAGDPAEKATGSEWVHRKV
eukprot:2501698-Amphidinium_carterae.1